jgi:hypothetical protein
MPASPFNPFTRVFVDYAIKGSVRISFTYAQHFYDSEPWTINVQIAESELVPNTQWKNVAFQFNATNTNVVIPLTSFVIDNQLVGTKLTLHIPSGKEQNLFYRLKLVAGANTYYSPVASVLGDLPMQQWLWYQELVRKETLRLSRQNVGNQGYLLKAMRAGTPCNFCTDNDTQEQTDANCPNCFGQRFSGGYYTASANFYYDRQPMGRYQHDDINRGIVDDSTVTKARVIAFPFLSSYDVVVDLTSDLRFYIHDVKSLYELRSVPVVQEVTLKQIPFSNIIYTFPVS